VGTLLLYAPVFTRPWSKGLVELLKSQGEHQAWHTIQNDVVWTWSLLRQWWLPGTPYANGPSWWVLSMVPSWLCYPFLAGPLHMAEGTHRPGFTALLLAAFGLALVQFIIASASWVVLCDDISIASTFPSSLQTSTRWAGSDLTYHPLTLLADFVIGAIGAAAARRHATAWLTAPKQAAPTYETPDSLVARNLKVDDVIERFGKHVRRRRLALVADGAMLLGFVLVLFVPRPRTYLDACPFNTNITALQVGVAADTTAYFWDPFALFTLPFLGLLAGIHLYATSLCATDDECGSCAKFLAHFSSLSPYCLAIVLWQVPFSHFFYWGTSANQELFLLFVLALIVWSVFYTDVVEKYALQVFKRAWQSFTLRLNLNMTPASSLSSLPAAERDAQQATDADTVIEGDGCTIKLGC